MTDSSACVPVLRPCGDTAWLLDLDDNRLVHRWAAAVRKADLPGVCEVVPGLSTLLVTLDPDLTDADTLRAALGELEPALATTSDDEQHLIEVSYDGEDLDAVAHHTGLSVAEVVAAHADFLERLSVRVRPR